MEIIYKNENGSIIHGDNLEYLAATEGNSVDSCISDFPYDLSFMGKKWDKIDNFYEWNKLRAQALYRVMKPGGYVAIFGHPKTNHRMKCAFEDSGFKIVEEIDWIYFSGLPKNQDISKLFDKDAGATRETIGIKLRLSSSKQEQKIFNKDNRTEEEINAITAPSSDMAKKWNGWKTSGLKPAHEPITIFQKPLEGTYIQNIEKYGCGAMNIDACRVPISKTDIDKLNAKASRNPTTNYSDKNDKIYGKFAIDIATPVNDAERFPANIILDEYTANILDEQTDNGSRLFSIIKYHPKASPSERKLPDGSRNPHVTLKPIALIKWLIKLLTPIDGTTIDITAGSCTHSIAAEELNRNEGYHLKWIEVEIMNTKEEPYCNVGKARLEHLESVAIQMTLY